MTVSFLSPLGALLAAAAVMPLAAFLLVERRARRLRLLLRLSPPRRLSWVPLALSLCSGLALVCLAAAQPVLAVERTRYSRTDAEVFFVLDTSRSMLAASRPGAPTRSRRARLAAKRLREALPDVPVGLASLTDRALPHLFPTADAEAFSGALRHSLGIEQPPPQQPTLRTTAFSALAALRTQNFFSPAAERRLAVIFTDGESQRFPYAMLRNAFGAGRDIKAIFVRFWRGDERVFSAGGRPEVYRPDPASGRATARLAETIGGEVYTEEDLPEVTRAARRYVGRGERTAQGRERRATHLAPYAVLAAFAPFAYLLWRRNLS